MLGARRPGPVARDRGRLRAAPAPADPDRVHRQPVARAADAADDGQPAGRDADPRGRGRGRRAPAQMRDRIGKIEVETGHLVQMVSELLDLSRIESGGGLGVVDLVDLGQVATESTERLRLFADRQGVALRVDRAGPIPPVRGDAAAARARSSSTSSTTPSSSAPTAATSRSRSVASGAEVVVAIADHGVGIPRARRRGSSNGSTRSTGRASGARPAGPGLAWPSRGTSSSSTAAGSGSNPPRASGARSRSRCRSPASGSSLEPPDRTAKDADGPIARRHAQHPEPRRPLVRTAAAPARRHGRAPAGPARVAGGRLPDAAGPSPRGGRRGPTTARSAAGRADRSTATACWFANRSSRPTRTGVDLGLEPVGATVRRSRLPGGTSVLVVVTHLHHLGPDEGIRDEQTTSLLEWLEEGPAATPRS